MWGMKWVFATVFTDENVIYEAINQIGLRTSNANEEMALSIFDTISSNLTWFFNTPFTIIMIVFLFIQYILCVNKQIKMKIPTKEIVRISVPFLMIAILPCIWYSLTINHSYIHSWFTHKTLVMSAFALMCMPLKIKNRLKS